jgi:hypothetical protein
MPKYIFGILNDIHIVTFCISSGLGIILVEKVKKSRSINLQGSVEFAPIVSSFELRHSLHR